MNWLVSIWWQLWYLCNELIKFFVNMCSWLTLDWKNWIGGVMEGMVHWIRSILNLKFQHNVLLMGWYPHVNSSFFPRFQTISFLFQIQTEFREIQTPCLLPPNNLWVQNFWKMKKSKIYKNIFLWLSSELLLSGIVIPK